MTTTAKTPVKQAAMQRPNTVADYINWQVNLCGKKQLEIAEQAGFAKPNMITMLKQGKTKVPLEKIGALARALEVDPVHLFKLVLAEYLPETYSEITKMFGQPVLTQNEIELVEVIRESKVENPRLRTQGERKALLDVINTFRADNQTNN